MVLSKEEIVVLEETFLFHNMERHAFHMLTQRTDLNFRRIFLLDGEALQPTEETHYLGILTSGTLLAYQGKKVPDRPLHPGFVLGALDLFSRRTTPPPLARSKGTSTLLLISADQLRRLFSEYPSIMMNYINFLTGQIHALRLENQLAVRTPEKRLGLFLQQYWEPCPEGYRVRLPFSLSALAERLGLSRSALYRLLDQLEEDQVIARQGKAFTVLQPDFLIDE